MKLSTRARYGVRAMLSLALDHGKGPIPLKAVAEGQAVSEKYLEHMMAPLRSAGLVRSVRGAHGGYCLARPPAHITLREVVGALEGSVAPVDCLHDASLCQRAPTCASRLLWERMEQAITDILKSTTLRDLAQQQRECEQSEATMYHI